MTYDEMDNNMKQQPEEDNFLHDEEAQQGAHNDFIRIELQAEQDLDFIQYDLTMTDSDSDTSLARSPPYRPPGLTMSSSEHDSDNDSVCNAQWSPPQDEEMAGPSGYVKPTHNVWATPYDRTMSRYIPVKSGGTTTTMPSGAAQHQRTDYGVDITIADVYNAMRDVRVYR